MACDSANRGVSTESHDGAVAGDHLMGFVMLFDEVENRSLLLC